MSVFLEKIYKSELKISKKYYIFLNDVNRLELLGKLIFTRKKFLNSKYEYLFYFLLLNNINNTSSFFFNVIKLLF